MLGSLVFCIFLVLGSTSGAINRRFPPNFHFGTATAAYQVEGAWNEDGKGENIWDHYTHYQPDRIVNGDTADVACDSYHKWQEDIANLKYLGVHMYRFSLSWSRLLPSGFINEVNEAAVNYYNNLIDALVENGIEPYVTIYHWDLPQPLFEMGGWPNPLLEDIYADYARLAFTLFGDRVKNWMTFNEPKQTCQQGYGIGTMAPGYFSDGLAEYWCAHTILKSHARAYHIYDDEFRSSQQGRVTLVIDTDWFEPVSDDPLDLEAAERKIQFFFGWYTNAVYSAEGNYPQVMIDRVDRRSRQEGFARSRLPKFTPEEVAYIQGTYDFFALNHYTTNLAQWVEDEPIGTPSFLKDTSVYIHQDPAWNGSASSWLKVVPWGLRRLLNWIHITYDGPEIVITENGFSDEGQLDDDARIYYYSEYLSNVLEAILDDGVNVTGYTAWSLMDNMEWARGYSEKYGLYRVDFDDVNRTRTIKASGEYYKRVIETHCLVDVCVD